jgi:hypothetical protein
MASPGVRRMPDPGGDMAENQSADSIGDDGEPTDRAAASGVAPPPAEARTGAPRWMKVFGIVGVVLVVLVVVMLLTGHGPGRHMHGALGAQATSTRMTEVLSAFGEQRP